MTEKTPQQLALEAKIKEADKAVAEANAARKQLDRQLKWLGKARAEIDAEIVRRIENRDEGARKWVEGLRQQVTAEAWERSEADRQEAERAKARKAAEAAQIAQATATPAPQRAVPQPNSAA